MGIKIEFKPVVRRRARAAAAASDGIRGMRPCRLKPFPVKQNNIERKK
ncbi:hypothetical protein NMH_0476 [Neisseria meningitidis H44/76]|uniref:Uncharacterized protein n=1 Tax=Neisseria meningitidis serogroup B / serotype 15 (strain H44/76) TaxID=909420 RepID=E6MUM8_NEIMH|nr:hypothetical protein NMH_0476 [Neisseria meningitidis H44/76]